MDTAGHTGAFHLAHTPQQPEPPVIPDEGGFSNGFSNGFDALEPEV